MRSIVSVHGSVRCRAPGRGETTVSPSGVPTSRWSLLAMRRRAGRRSPPGAGRDHHNRLPEKSSISRGWISSPSGAFAIPEIEMLKFLRIERPTRGDFAVEPLGGINHLLNAVDVGRERGDDDPPLQREKVS